MKAQPPTGTLWDLPLKETTFAFVDLEMTGLDPTADHVIEVCIVRTVGDRVADTLDTLVRPPSRAGGNAAVHGLVAEALASARSFDAIIPEIEKLLEGAIFVAHAAEWDIKFLAAEMARAKRPFEVPWFLDTLVLSRRAFVAESHSLDALCTQLGIDRGVAHRAAPDVAAMREVFRRCVAELEPTNARDLWEVRIATGQARPALVQACEAAAKYGSPVEVTYRPSGRKPEILLMVVTEVRTSLDPPRVMGYLLPGRGRRELRADRILKVRSPDSTT